MEKSKEYLLEIKNALRGHYGWLDNKPNNSKADFSNFDMSGMTLNGLRLSRALFIAADLSRAKLAGCDLSGAILYCADLAGADLSRANLVGADLRGANLCDAQLSGANLSGADLRSASAAGDHPLAGIERYDRAVGKHTRATEARDADFAGSILFETNLEGCDLSGAELKGADLTGANLREAVLVGANVEEASFGDADAFEAAVAAAILDAASVAGLSRAGVAATDRRRDLRGNLAALLAEHARWTGSNGKTGRRLEADAAILDGADLAGLDLRGARLRRCSLRDARLAGANLALAEFAYADLTGADLAGANLSGASFKSAHLASASLAEAEMHVIHVAGDRTRPWPANFARAKLDQADLRVKSAANMLLDGTDLSNTRLNLAVLRFASLEKATLPPSITQEKLAQLQVSRAAQVLAGPSRRVIS